MSIIRNDKSLKEQFGEQVKYKTDYLEHIDVYLLPHYGHLACLEFTLRSGYRYPLHNNTNNLGAILHNLSKILEIREDGCCLSCIKCKNCTSVWVDTPFGEQCIGIGHPWSGEYILFEDFGKAEV